MGHTTLNMPNLVSSAGSGLVSTGMECSLEIPVAINRKLIGGLFNPQISWLHVHEISMDRILNLQVLPNGCSISV